MQLGYTYLTTEYTIGTHGSTQQQVNWKFTRSIWNLDDHPDFE